MYNFGFEYFMQLVVCTTKLFIHHYNMYETRIRVIRISYIFFLADTTCLILIYGFALQEVHYYYKRLCVVVDGF